MAGRRNAKGQFVAKPKFTREVQKSIDKALMARAISHPRYLSPEQVYDQGLFTESLAAAFTRMNIWMGLIRGAMQNGMREWAEIVERDMQDMAEHTWKQNTGHARGALRSYLYGDDPRIPEYADEPAPTIALAKDEYLVVSTGFMHYNKWLEVRWGGKFAVIWPTVTANTETYLALLVKYGSRVT